VLQRARVPTPSLGEQRDLGAGQVGERLGLEIAPQVLDRIKFRGIGREVELLPAHHVEEHRGAQAAMDLRAVPEQKQRIMKVAGELAQESQHRRRIEVLIDQQLKVQAHLAPVGTDAQGGDGRDLLVVARDVPEHRGLSASAPGAPYHRQQEQPALVEKN
jgi:hypothetical protein